MVTVSYVGNSANINGMTTPGLYILAGGTGTISVAGIGTFKITDAVDVYSNHNTATPTVGIYDITTTGTILGTASTLFANYDLTAPFGPVSSTAVFKSGVMVATAGGTFELTGLTAPTSTFTASVPEPSCLVMAGTGVLGLAAARFRRRRAIARAA